MSQSSQSQSHPPRAGHQPQPRDLIRPPLHAYRQPRLPAGGPSQKPSLQNLFLSLIRRQHQPKHAGVVLSYTTFIFLIITQLVLTNLALVRLHRNSFPPITRDLQQMGKQQALPLNKAATWMVQTPPLDPEHPFHDELIQDQTFSGQYQAHLLPSAVIRTVSLTAKDPSASPHTYQSLLVQTTDHAWTLRHYEY